jgi:hypothetical protein
MKKENFCRSAGIEGGCGRSPESVAFSAVVATVCMAALLAFIVVIGMLRLFGVIGG